MSTKAMSLRLPEPVRAELHAVGRALGVPISELVREAIEKHIEHCANDPDFKKLAKKKLEEDMLLLEALTAEDGQLSDHTDSPKTVTPPAPTRKRRRVKDDIPF